MQNNESHFSVSTILEENENNVLFPNAVPPWPEWNEEELNSTNWDEFDEFRYRVLPIVFGTDREFSEKIGPERIEWRRLHEIFPGEDYQVIEENQPPFIQQDTVFASNRHLMATEIFRMLFYSLKNVSFISTFKQNEEMNWEPWKHVHRQEYNPKGKYFVRLSFLGKWRKLVVDDYFPCDVDSGELLIPFVSPKQLWLPLLSKAILVVASLNGYDWRKTSICNLLTGCFSHCVNQSCTTEKNLWKVVDENVPYKKDTIDRIEDSKERLADDETPKSDGLTGEKETVERYVLATVESTAVPDLNTSVSVLIQLVINQCHLRKYAKNWKDIRYNQWAYERGILKEKLPCSNSIGHIQIFCPVRKMPVTQVETEMKEVENDPGNLTTTLVNVSKPKEDTEVIHGELPLSDEICTWLEFPKIYAHLVILETLFVPSSFEHQFSFSSVTDFTAVSTYVSEGEEYGTEEAGNPIFHDLVPQLSFYVYMDSLQSSTLYFVVETCYEFTAKSSRLIFKNNSDTSLVIESFCWKDIALDFNDDRKIQCSRTVKLTLSPGVNIFKLWYSPGERFFVGVFGTAEFKLVPRYKLNLLLSNQSLHFSAVVQDIVSKLNTLLHTPLGTPEHGHAYNKFIESFCPRKYFDETKHINTRIQIKMDVLRRFEDLLIEKILTYNFGSQLSNMQFSTMSTSSVGPPMSTTILYLIYQCREVFQDPAFGESYLKQNAPHYYYLVVSSSQIDMSSELHGKKKHRSKLSKVDTSSLALVKRKRVREKRLRTKEAAANASKMSMVNSALEDILETNAAEFYSLLTATSGVTQKDDVVLSDLRHFVNFIEISGSIEKLTPKTWRIIARLNLNLHATTDSLIGLYFYLTNAEDYRLQYELVRNKIPNGETIRSVKMSNHLYNLRREEFGYTLLVYGYCLAENIEGSGLDRHVSEIRWRLHIISNPGTENALHVCQLFPVLEVIDLEEEESENRPHPFCDLGSYQSAPDVKIIEFTGDIEADTKYERLKFRLVTWAGNIVTLRFKLESSCYKTTICIVKRGGRCEDGVENGEESEAILGSCFSFVKGENVVDGEANEHQIVFSEESDDGEIILPAIVTTPDSCNHDNGSLTLEGTIQIVYKSEQNTSDQRLVDAKGVLIKEYLTREKPLEIGTPTTSESRKDGFPCERISSPITYSLIAAHTFDPARAADKELSLEVESDLLDYGDPEVVESIQRGKDKRTEFLCKLFRDAPCLGHMKRKVPRLQVVLTEIFGRESTKTHDVNREFSDLSRMDVQEQFMNDRANEAQSLNKLSQDGSEVDEDSKNKWRNFYDQMLEALRSGPNCYDKTRARLYRERNRYIQFRNYEREKYAPNLPEPSPETNESTRAGNPTPEKPKTKEKKKNGSNGK